MKTNRTVSAIAMCCGLGFALPGVAAAAGAGDWAGWYAGGHAGYATANDVVVDFVPNNPSDSFDMDGYVIGVQGGYNWAVGNVVLGIEADAAYADMEGDALCPNPAWTCGSRMDQLLTLRGRAGMPINNFLVYGTLGLASGKVEAFDGPTGGEEYPDSSTNTGWAAGVGAEMAFNNKLSGRVELLYVDLGTNSYLIDPPPGDSADVETKVISLRVGANWKF